MKSDLCLAVVVVIIGVGIVLGLIGGVNHLCWIGDKADIEELRISIQSLDPIVAEDVLELVIRKNCHIQSNRAYNQKWWTDWFIPDGWNDVALIEIPTSMQK